jgi:hypothetical protein
MRYHYGKAIREHREANNMTLSQLAAKWPNSR